MQPLPSPGADAHRAPNLPIHRTTNPTDKTTSQSHQAASATSSAASQAGHKSSTIEAIVRREWDSISQKHFKPTDELISALAAIPDLNAICQTLVKNGWKIEFGPENRGSHASVGKREIVIDGKHKVSRAAILTATRHETTHASHDLPAVIEKYLETLLLGEKLSEDQFISACADNEGHAMLSEFQLLTMSEHDPALQQEIDEHLQKKFDKADPSGEAYRKGIAFHEQWRSAGAEAKEEVTLRASRELGLLYADFVGMNSQRVYRESWKADYAKMPFARPLLNVRWALPSGEERRLPYLVKIDARNFESALDAYADPRKAREIMTYAVNHVAPTVNKDPANGDIWNVDYLFSKDDRDYKVHYKYDFWLDGLDGQKFHIEELVKPPSAAKPALMAE